MVINDRLFAVGGLQSSHTDGLAAQSLIEVYDADLDAWSVVEGAERPPVAPVDRWSTVAFGVTSASRVAVLPPPPKASPAGGQLAKGTRVVIRGLTNAASHNGTEATVVRFDEEKGRYAIQQMPALTPDDALRNRNKTRHRCGRQPGKNFSVKPENLEVRPSAGEGSAGGRVGAGGAILTIDEDNEVTLHHLSDDGRTIVAQSSEIVNEGLVENWARGTYGPPALARGLPRSRRLTEAHHAADTKGLRALVGGRDEASFSLQAGS